MYDFDTTGARQGVCSVKWDIARRQGMPEGTIPFTIADMELRTAPEIIEAVKNAAECGLWGYSYAEEGFKQAVANWMRTRHGWPAETDWMVNTTGVVPAIFTAVRAFTKPGDGVIVQPPVYTPFFEAITRGGRIVAENPLKIENNTYKIDFEDLREKCKAAKMMVFCSPHNPVGRVWSREEVAEVARICRENGVLLFSDEIHCDILPGERAFTSAAGLGGDTLQNLIVGTAASKSFSLAGLGCSSIFIPNEDLRKTFAGQMHQEGQEFNTAFGVVATRAAYEQGGPWLAELLEYLRGNIALLRQTLAGRMPYVKMAPLEGTYLAWLDFSALGMEEPQLMAVLHQEAGVFLGSGTAYGTGGAGFLRMNLACPREQIKNALERMEAILAPLV